MSNESRKSVNLTGTDPRVSRSPGPCNENTREPVPFYNKAPSEKIISAPNNSWIILGRDRTGSECSGYGGAAHTQAGSIDIFVGLGAPWPREYVGTKQTIPVDKNFITDAARIYISQKTDVDSIFNLPAGSVGISKASSAVAIKADDVRLIARRGIKLVTNTDTVSSQGGKISSTSGIDLIAGNNDAGLQPLVLGDYLIDALLYLLHHIEKLNGVVDTVIMAQSQFNEVLANHWHQSPFSGLPTGHSIPAQYSGIVTLLDLLQKGKMGLVANRANFANFRSDYLTISGGKWILSRHNNAN